MGDMLEEICRYFLDSAYVQRRSILIGSLPALIRDNLLDDVTGGI